VDIPLLFVSAKVVQYHFCGFSMLYAAEYMFYVYYITNPLL
jgi:hypothetical protein